MAIIETLFVFHPILMELSEVHGYWVLVHYKFQKH